MKRREQKLGLATIAGGAPEILRETLTRLARQTRAPEVTLVMAPTPRALPGALPQNIRPVLGPPGAAALRNSALDILARECDVAVLIGADFFPSYDFIDKIMDLFSRQPRLVGALGHSLAGGARPGAPIAPEDADRILSAYEIKAKQAPKFRLSSWLKPGPMAIRLESARHLRFDENLPGEGYLMEVDFSHRLSRFGRVAQVDHFVGIACGEPQRPQDFKLAAFHRGYAQIANPVYLAGKGSMAPRSAYLSATVAVLSNLTKRVTHPAACESMALAHGNWQALADLMRDDLRPSRILEI